MANSTLNTARQQKNDEFYTQLIDIENELKHYKNQFRSKVIFCNCDDPYESNFFKYFASNFNFLGLKKLIATSYTKSPIAGTQLSLFELEGLKPDGKQPFKVEITEVPDSDGDGAVDLSDVQYLLKHDKNSATPLRGNGDFRSEECLQLLKEADIVVTNPPFSLFREYVQQLIKYQKKFLIIGNKNAVAYKEIFKLIQDNKVWLGYRNINSDMWLMVPEGEKYEKIANGVKLKHIMACWFTNLETIKRHEEFVMYKKYTAEEYPPYVNYDAIEVAKVTDIPADYEGKMGLPITFLDKYNPEQFEIIGSSLMLGKPMSEIAEKGTYSQGGPTFYIAAGSGKYKRLYHRVVIKNKKVKK